MWFPLESNPDVMNRYLVKLGIAEPKLEFVDVFGVSDDLLAMVPSPVYAVMLVYPICEATERSAKALAAAQAEEIAAFREKHTFFFTRQFVANACGTIAICHAVMNNREAIGDITPDSPADDFVKALEGTVDAEVVGDRIASSTKVGTAHASAASEGATENQPIDASIDLHFVCFISAGGRCIELDGRRKQPLLHGACDDSASFLKAAAAAIQEKMELNPDSYEFGITALVQKKA